MSQKDEVDGSPGGGPGSPLRRAADPARRGRRGGARGARQAAQPTIQSDSICATSDRHRLTDYDMISVANQNGTLTAWIVRVRTKALISSSLLSVWYFCKWWRGVSANGQTCRRSRRSPTSGLLTWSEPRRESWSETMAAVNARDMMADVDEGRG